MSQQPPQPSQTTKTPQDLDRWLSPPIREAIEQRYYAKVNRLARWEALRHDASFLEALRENKPHVGVFSDHGVVHVRDVAQRTLVVLERVHGLLIPPRSPERLESLHGLCVLLAYFHDVGMCDFSPVGRAMHPEFAARCLFETEQGNLVSSIWAENAGELAGRLAKLEAAGALNRPPQVVLREVLALSMAHSKSKVPIDMLNDRARLRRRLMTALSSDLASLYAAQRGAAPLLADTLLCTDDAFDWLLSDHPAARALTDDIIDAVRVLRCADALRQRGTVLKTSGGYEIFVSRLTGKGVYAFMSPEGQLYLLEDSDPMSAGEANIAASEIDTRGDMRVAFHRGSFDTHEGLSFAVNAAATVVGDMFEDILHSFDRPPGEKPEGLKPVTSCNVLLEETDDFPEFATRVIERLETRYPALRGRAQLTSSLRDASDRERALYLDATPVDWPVDERREWLNRLGRAGQLVAAIDPVRAFQGVRLASLRPGDDLIVAGEPAAFVYVPLEEGLVIHPLGGYAAFAARAWVPLGVTGVLRGAMRNATVTAEAPVGVVIIPKGIYLREWLRVYSPATLLQTIQPAPTSEGRWAQEKNDGDI